MDFFNCHPLGVDHVGNHFRLACSDAKHLPKSKKVQERCLKNWGSKIQEQSGFFIKNKRLIFLDEMIVLPCWKEVKVLNLIQNFPQIFEIMIQKISSCFLVQPPVFGPPFKLVSGDDFSAPSAVLPKMQEVDSSELNVVWIHYILFSIFLGVFLLPLSC